MIDGDPVASSVREIMAQRKTWIGTAGELLSLGAGCSGDRLSWRSWPKNPRALAGRLRRAQTPLRSLGIEIVFSREGRAGTRIIKISDTSKFPLGERRDNDLQLNGRFRTTANPLPSN
jgi:hypothetical protein